jgi:thiol-disulfide isomerase/thioredoxin
MYDTLDTIRVQRTYIDSLQPTYHLQTFPNATHSSLVEERPLSIISVPANAPPPVFSSHSFSQPAPPPVFSSHNNVSLPRSFHQHAQPDSISQPISMPQSISQPISMPQSISQPISMPQSISQPISMPQSISQPISMPQSISQPISMPQSSPQSISQPISMPQSSPQSISQPISMPQSIPQSISQPAHLPNDAPIQPYINEQISSLNSAIQQLRQEHMHQQKEIEYLKKMLEAKEHYTEREYQPKQEPQNELPLKKDEIPIIHEPSPHDNITIHDYTDETIKNISGTTLILFYTPTCPHCVTLKPLYTFMAPIFIKRNITVGMLNGVDNRNTLREFKIQGVPTIILVHNNERHVYQGQRVLKDIVHWVQHVVTGVDLNLIKEKSITPSE